MKTIDQTVSQEKGLKFPEEMVRYFKLRSRAAQVVFVEYFMTRLRRYFPLIIPETDDVTNFYFVETCTITDKITGLSGFSGPFN